MVQVKLNDGLVLVENFELLGLVLFVVLGGEHQAEVIDERLYRQQPLVTFDKINEKVEAVFIRHVRSRHYIARSHGTATEVIAS